MKVQELIELQKQTTFELTIPYENVLFMIKKYGIEDTIEEYKCKVANNNESIFWKECLKISKKIKNDN